MRSLILLPALTLFSQLAWAEPDLPGLDTFINEMVTEHQFDAKELEAAFAEVEVKDSILKAIARPAEKAKPWYEYRNIFMDQGRIHAGAEYWQAHADTLKMAEQTYGVPAEIILAILGVETRFGGNVGSFRVIDALSTLAFQYPPRSKFFRSELKHFLILSREEAMPPLEPIGSYAGAMGLGQFMPSSYRAYAVDFDADGHRDIWTNPVDAIGSIANYLHEHGWRAGESIVHPTTTANDSATAALIERGLKPSISRDEAKAAGLSLENLPADAKNFNVFSLTQRYGDELWLGRQNFYAITRYNHSRMYAMAVVELSEAIRARYERIQ